MALAIVALFGPGLLWIGGSFTPANPGIRSAHGKQTACLLSENSRAYQSLVTSSNGQGQMWDKIMALEDDPGGHYCYTAIELVVDHVLLAYCAGQRDGGGLATTQMTRFSLEWLYR